MRNDKKKRRRKINKLKFKIINKINLKHKMIKIV